MRSFLPCKVISKELSDPTEIMRIKFSPPPPTPELLTKDFLSATRSHMEILTKENLVRPKLLALQFPGLSLP